MTLSQPCCMIQSLPGRAVRPEHVPMSSQDYTSQADYVRWVSRLADERSSEVAGSLRQAFHHRISKELVEIIEFERLPAEELARTIVEYPLVLKPLLIAANVAARSIERDLGIKGVNTYSPKLTEQQALAISGYLAAFLPPTIALPSLVLLDRTMFMDKEIRRLKGDWETAVVQKMNTLAPVNYRKTRFVHDEQTYELDAAAFDQNGSICHAVDVKRIEARRDVHKRIDEIAGKAIHFKAAYPDGQFAAIIYYPFTKEHDSVANRLRSPNIDSIVFAGSSSKSIEAGVRRLLRDLRCIRS